MIDPVCRKSACDLVNGRASDGPFFGSSRTPRHDAGGNVSTSRQPIGSDLGYKSSAVASDYRDKAWTHALHGIWGRYEAVPTSAHLKCS